MFLFDLVFEAGVSFRVGIGVEIGVVLGGTLDLSITFCLVGVTSLDCIDILLFDWLCANSVGADGFGILLEIGGSFVPRTAFGSSMFEILFHFIFFLTGVCFLLLLFRMKSYTI